MILNEDTSLQKKKGQFGHFEKDWQGRRQDDF